MSNKSLLIHTLGTHWQSTMCFLEFQSKISEVNSSTLHAQHHSVVYCTSQLLIQGLSRHKREFPSEGMNALLE